VVDLNVQERSNILVIDPAKLPGSGQLPALRGPVQVSFGAWPEIARATAFREFLARLGYRYQLERLPDTWFKAELNFNALPDLIVMEGQLHGSRNRRTREIIDDCRDEAMFLVNLRGPHLVEQFGREVVLGDGDAVLVSGNDPSCFTHHAPGNLLGLRIPKSPLLRMLRAGDGNFMRSVPAGTAALSLLRDYVGLTWERDVAADPALARLMSGQIVELIAATIGATRDGAEQARLGGLRAARLQRARQEISRRMTEPDLSLVAMAEQLHCTPRSLQRLFESSGTTFSDFLLEERLARAYRMLGDPWQAAQKISSIALDCGFNDVSYFNRAFRRRYGAAPGDVRSGSSAGSFAMPG
jgi:AraC-like DNA-binding protein